MSKQIPQRPLQPSDLSQDQVARLVEGLRRGNDPETVCHLCGVSPDLYDRWMQKGIEAKWGQYADFYRDMKTAEAEAERFAVEAWRDQFEKSWQACREFLKMRYPERWGGGDEKSEPLSIVLYLPEPTDAL